METAKVFTTGRSQAVRIPKEYRFDTEELYINKIGDTVILTPFSALAEAFDKGARMLSEDFLSEGIPDSFPSERIEL
ncbi:MAG: AbrB/MazE/SpoVT family DNA-binding domain-containing protein [Anaerolineaceae bacterium]|nr:AbrB/MazE/SpoVT family DNA-binding domain-containing protein [Anaerolineaceae bacterium]